MSKVAEETKIASRQSRVGSSARASIVGDDFGAARNGFGEGTGPYAGSAVDIDAGGSTLGTLGANFSTTRGGLNTFLMQVISFDTSDISFPPSEASITLTPRTLAGTAFNNVQDDHKWIIAAHRREAPTLLTSAGSSIDSALLVTNTNKSLFAGGDAAGTRVDDFTKAPMFEGFVSGSSFATQGRFYTEPLKVSGSLVTDPGASGGMAGAQAAFTVTLNKNAREDMATYDRFLITLSDYSSYVLNVDMATSSPSPGATSEWLAVIGTSTTDAAAKVATLTFKEGRIDDSVPIKDRIENDFTLNTYEDVSVQRKRFVKDGVFVDQVPFLLGTKGPLSLRGRQFDNNGKPISTTVEPPNTSKS